MTDDMAEECHFPHPFTEGRGLIQTTRRTTDGRKGVLIFKLFAVAAAFDGLCFVVDGRTLQGNVLLRQRGNGGRPNERTVSECGCGCRAGAGAGRVQVPGGCGCRAGADQSMSIPPLFRFSKVGINGGGGDNDGHGHQRRFLRRQQTNSRLELLGERGQLGCNSSPSVGARSPVVMRRLSRKCQHWLGGAGRRNSTSGTPRAIDRHHLQQNEQNHFDQNLRLFTLSATMKEGTTDFLSLLEKMQSQRMDDQRCEMPSGKGRNQANFLI
uniref:Uncharacterized protein n=1 Tax=Globodera rostochiensis TaxID=31243 RepID=A0A914GXZ3_GLORO